MMFIYEFIPVLLFFIAFKLYDIYIATIVGIIATSIQVTITWLAWRRWDKKQVVTLLVFVIFGGLTLYFHDPIFVKLKPTIAFYIFSLAIFISMLTKRPLMQRLIEHMMKSKNVIPTHVWRWLNLLWACFFLGLGTLNLYIAYNFSDNAWVNFKFYGITSALFLLSVFQALYLFRFMAEKPEDDH